MNRLNLELEEAPPPPDVSSTPLNKKGGPRPGTTAQKVYRFQGSRDRAATLEVLALHKIRLTGNIQPRPWKNHLRMASGRVDLSAITVLSEICYWYSATIDVAEDGKTEILKRKFYGDILQKSYADLAESTGLTKRQVQDAVLRLEKAGLIIREPRIVERDGLMMFNVLFIRVCPDAIRNITFEKQDTVPRNIVGGYTTQRRTPYVVKHDLPRGSERQIHESPKNPPNNDPIIGTTTKFEASESENGTGDDGDPGTIEKILEAAFQGQPFSPAESAGLAKLIAKGWIFRLWAEAFAEAKQIFDPSRDAYRKRGIYLPYTPGHLVKNVDLTRRGILSILGELYSQFEKEWSSTMEREEFEKFQSQLWMCDQRFRAEGFLGADGTVTAHKGHLKIALYMLTETDCWEGGGLSRAICPPAWMRMLFAYRHDFCFPTVKAALLKNALRELSLDPRPLTFPDLALSDCDAMSVFGIKVREAVEAWNQRRVLLDKRMERLEELLSVVAESESAGVAKNSDAKLD